MGSREKTYTGNRNDKGFLIKTFEVFQNPMVVTCLRVPLGSDFEFSVSESIAINQHLKLFGCFGLRTMRTMFSDLLKKPVPCR